jgi:hypothetical protein
MALVYEAEQDQPQRVVALKVVKTGLAEQDSFWRFDHAIAIETRELRSL